LAANLGKLQGSLGLQIEAEAEYAPFAAVLQTITPQSLEIALALHAQKQNPLKTDLHAAV
jgi:hypothetical protein